MLNEEQIRRITHDALVHLDHVRWYAAQVALFNLRTYGYLSAENVTAIRSHA